MSENLKAANFAVEAVGKRYKNSKLHYTWTFEIENEKHTVQLYTSKLSNKKKVVVDDQVVFMGSGKSAAFRYVFMLKNRNMAVYFDNGQFDIMIDNYMSFKSIYAPAARDKQDVQKEDKKQEQNEKENEKPKDKSPEKKKEDYNWEDWATNDPFMKVKNPSTNWEEPKKVVDKLKRSHIRSSSMVTSPVSIPRQPECTKVEVVLKPHPTSSPAGDLLYFEPTPQPEPQWFPGADVRASHPAPNTQMDIRSSYPAPNTQAELRGSYPAPNQQFDLRGSFQAPNQQADLRTSYPAPNQMADLRASFPTPNQQVNLRASCPGPMQAIPQQMPQQPFMTQQQLQMQMMTNQAAANQMNMGYNNPFMTGMMMGQMMGNPNMHR